MKMSLGTVEPKHGATKDDKVDTHDLQEKNVYHSEVLGNPDLMNSAFDGESQEHAMGPWEAAKMHPMACFWAFFMCFTIVSPGVRRASSRAENAHLMWPYS
jgi:SP family general alpha glucoside:H+ symporter-like MFS transporter